MGDVNFKKTGAGYSIHQPLVRISYGRNLVNNQLVSHRFELSDLVVQTIDTLLKLLGASLVLAGSGLSANILGSEAIDVAFVLATDQIEQVLVIEALAFAGLVADDSIVVQIDLNIIQVLVFQSVEHFCFARFFRLFFHNVLLLSVVTND